jgi:hypothetical protein
MTEQEKYEAIWTHDAYRQGSPGERVAPVFVEWSGIEKGNTLIDFGTGSGRGAKRIHELTGGVVVALDFAANSLNDDIKDAEWIDFRQADLTKPIGLHAQFGFCADVMEHIPPEDVETVIRNIMAAADRVFFQISLVQDSFGKLLGKGVHLHLSVFPFLDWKAIFRKLGYSILKCEERPGVGLFYVEAGGGK